MKSQNSITNIVKLIQIQTENCNPHEIKGYTHTHLRKKKNIINIFELRVIHTSVSMISFKIDKNKKKFYFIIIFFFDYPCTITILC